MLLNCGVGKDSWESLGLKGDEVSPKGNQPWIFTGRTDAEVEAPVLWPPDVKSPVQFNHLVMFDSLGPHGLQHARFPCLSPIIGFCTNSCPLSQWWHPTILSFVVPFSSCLQSFPASGSSPVSRFFTSGGQSIVASASAPVLLMNIQDWFPLGLTGWISLQSKGLSRVFSNTTGQKHQFFGTQLSLQSNSHIHTWPLEKP